MRSCVKLFIFPFTKNVSTVVTLFARRGRQISILKLYASCVMSTRARAHTRAYILKQSHILNFRITFALQRYNVICELILMSHLRTLVGC